MSAPSFHFFSPWYKSALHYPFSTISNLAFTSCFNIFLLQLTGFFNTKGSPFHKPFYSPSFSINFCMGVLLCRSVNSYHDAIISEYYLYQFLQTSLPAPFIQHYYWNCFIFYNIVFLNYIRRQFFLISKPQWDMSNFWVSLVFIENRI